jgi:hypothetical protein
MSGGHRPHQVNDVRVATRKLYKTSQELHSKLASLASLASATCRIILLLRLTMCPHMRAQLMLDIVVLTVDGQDLDLPVLGPTTLVLSTTHLDTVEGLQVVKHDP